MALWCMESGWIQLPESRIPRDEPPEKETNMNGIKPDQLPVGHQLRNALEQAGKVSNQEQPKGLSGLMGLQAFTPNPAVSPDLYTADAVAQATKKINDAFATTAIDLRSINFEQRDDGSSEVTVQLVFKCKKDISLAMREVVGLSYVRALVHRMGRDPQKCTYQIDCDTIIIT